MKQAHGHDLHFQGAQASAELIDGCEVNLGEHAAGGIEALRNAKYQVGFDEWALRLNKQVVKLWPCLAANVKDVFKAFSRHQRHPRPFALEYRVGGHR